MNSLKWYGSLKYSKENESPTKVRYIYSDECNLLFHLNLMETNCDTSKEVIVDIVLHFYDLGFNIL